MLIWTPTATEVLREASTKADSMNHREVHPLHLLWAMARRTGLDVLRRKLNDHDAAKLRFGVERDLNRLPVHTLPDGTPANECATPGPRMQRLLLRAAEFAATENRDGRQGRIGIDELLKALLQDDARTTVLLRAREEIMAATA